MLDGHSRLGKNRILDMFEFFSVQIRLKFPVGSRIPVIDRHIRFIDIELLDLVVICRGAHGGEAAARSKQDRQQQTGCKSDSFQDSSIFHTCPSLQNGINSNFEFPMPITSPMISSRGFSSSESFRYVTAPGPGVRKKRLLRLS